jgi:hypothetical protein
MPFAAVDKVLSARELIFIECVHGVVFPGQLIVAVVTSQTVVPLAAVEAVVPVGTVGPVPVIVAAHLVVSKTAVEC